MVDRILSIQEGRNIIVYKISYNENEFKNYLDYLESLYGYREKIEINALVSEDKLLTAGKYDALKKYCRVLDEFEILKELDKDEYGIKNCKVKIEVQYFSMISSILKEVFLSNGVLINATDFIKLISLIDGFELDFEFNKILDLNDKTITWDEIAKYSKSEEEYRKYVEYKRKRININDIKLNKNESKRISEDIYGIIDNLYKFFNIEQIAMFPITDNLTEVQEILRIFGQRNRDFESCYGSLDECSINIHGSSIINDLADTICNSYAKQKKEIKHDKEKYFSKVKSFFKF